MRRLLVALGLVTFVGPLVWAFAAGEGDRARIVEIWLLSQGLTVLFFGTSAWLRANEIRSWPRREGRVVASAQTGVYERGVLAMQLEVEYSEGGALHRIVTKERVLIAEVSRFSVGAHVALAVNPNDPHEGRLAPRGGSEAT